MAKRRKRRIWLYILAGLLAAILIFIVYYNIATRIVPPTELDPREMGFERQQVNDSLYLAGNSWLRLSKSGLWEMYLEGDAFELGIQHGLLAQELIRIQEVAFVDQIRTMIPSENYLNFLRYFTAWFNKDLDTYVQQEYLLEIYGVSAFASDSFEFIGPNYDRILNYHAAHDIGHALQNLNLVMCTAFGVWDERSSDSSLLTGRNFDFYVGDAFAENKIVLFVNPTHGYKFASITWGGMIGVVSGMNEKGLTVTLNAAKSEIPYGARTPVSIIAREILQYASTIDEAFEIATSRQAFVSESFLIGSAADNKAVVIEKSTDTTLIYDPDTNYIIQTNHFQSDHFKNRPLTIENMANKTSVYRHERVQEIIDETVFFDRDDAAALLRDPYGLGGSNIGMGNEKAINQFIAHHSVIFRPGQKRFWVSTAPWQLGPYICYNLDSVFMQKHFPVEKPLSDPDLEIGHDEFLYYGKPEYDDFIRYRTIYFGLQDAIKEKMKIMDEDEVVKDLIFSNPEHYLVYATLGRYFDAIGNSAEAAKYYKLALTKEIASAEERESIKEWLSSYSE